MTDMLTTSQVAEILGKSTRRVSQLVKSGRLHPALKLEGIRGAYLFTPQAVDRFLAAEEDDVRVNPLKTALINLKQLMEYEPQSELGERQKVLNEQQLRRYIADVGSRAA